MKKGVKQTLFIVIAAILVGVIAYPKVKPMLSSPGKSSQAQGKSSGAARGDGRSRAINVNGVVIQQQELADKIRSSGRLLPEEEVDLCFEATGRITKVDFVEGSRVRKGQLLAKVNDAQLQAQLQKLQAQLKLSQERLFRQKALLEKDAISREAYDQAATEIETLNADIALVKARIAETELRAPFDGIIGLRNVSEGTYANPSVKVAKLTKVSPLKIDFSIAGRYVDQVRKGAPVQFTVDSRLDTLNASVYAIESKADNTTNTLLVRTLYPNKNEELMPGLYANIFLTLSTIKNAIAVPAEALVTEMGVSRVFLYKSGKAKAAEVATGIRTESQVQIIRGLTVGDTLIATGILQLRDGSPVTLTEVN